MSNHKEFALKKIEEWSIAKLQLCQLKNNSNETENGKEKMDENKIEECNN